MKSTSRYIHYERIVYATNDNNEWTAKAAKTVEEATELIKADFEYHVEIDGFRLFRKRK